MVTDPGHQTVDKTRVCHLLVTYCDGRTKSEIKTSKEMEGSKARKEKRCKERMLEARESGRMGREWARLKWNNRKSGSGTQKREQGH